MIAGIAAGPEVKWGGSGWASVPEIVAVLLLLPVYCKRQKPPFNPSASCFSLSPVAKNIFTLHPEKMNSCLQDLYSLLRAI